MRLAQYFREQYHSNNTLMKSNVALGKYKVYITWRSKTFQKESDIWKPIRLCLIHIYAPSVPLLLNSFLFSVCIIFPDLNSYSMLTGASLEMYDTCVGHNQHARVCLISL